MRQVVVWKVLLVKVMDWVAQKAAKKLAETGRITVAVKDNGSLHTSLLSQQQWTRWQGLYIFFLPPYCSEMNLIESEWLQLKTHEIAEKLKDVNILMNSEQISKTLKHIFSLVPLPIL